MPVYQRFRVGAAADAKIVWATNLDEAKLRYGPDVQPADSLGPQPWNVYVIGHGYSLNGYVPRPAPAPRPRHGTLQVPEGITMVFYVDDFDMFSTPRETPTRLTIEDPAHPRPDAYPPFKVVPPGNPDNVAEHILVWPSLTTEVPAASMKQMIKHGTFPLNFPAVADPDTALLDLSEPLTDRCGLYIGSKKPMLIAPADWKNVYANLFKGNWTYLSQILDLVARHHVPTRVHWFACRSRYPGETGFFAQAISPFGRDVGDFDMDQAILDRAFAP